MIEGGASVISSFIKENLADELKLFIAPKILGHGITIGDGINLKSVADSCVLNDLKSRPIGEDILIEGFFKCSQDL